MQKKIITIVGARPQFIKLARVSHQIAQHTILNEILVHTGQHYDKSMSDVFFNELEIKQPDYYLGVGSGSHAVQTAQMLVKIEEVLDKEKPDLVLVYGDTNSTLAGALVAAKLSIPIAHIEAGLRSYNCNMPEEINRIVTDQLSSLLFVPTETAVGNLKKEGYSPNKVKLVGDVMLDAALFYGEKADQKSKILIENKLEYKKYILTTIHRQENTDDEGHLTSIITSLREVAKAMTVIFPLHPRTKKMLIHYNLWQKMNESVRVIDPVGFLDMIKLEKSAAVIATDSGGVQKEACFYGVPCVTLRDETEWSESLTNGFNTLASPLDRDMIVQTILAKTKLCHSVDIRSIYGDGHAADRITKELLAHNI